MMLAGLAWGSEIKRFGSSRLTRIAVVVLTLLPLVYGALYLWAFEDPFGRVDKMPVALVNSDRGAVVAGQQTNVGDEIVSGIAADASLDWHVVDDAEARRGVDHGDYYFMLELPPDFTEAIASPLTGNPKKAELNAIYNDATNYVSMTIGRSAVQQVLNAVSTRIAGQAVNQVLSVVVSSGAGITKAADASGQLADGAARVDDGVQELVTGLDTALPGSRRLADGAQQLSTGIDTATDPLLTMADAVAQIGGNTEQLEQGGQAVQQAADQIGAIAAAQDASADTIATVVDQLRASGDPVAQNAATTLEGVEGQLQAHQFTPQIRQQLTDAQNAAIALTSTLRSPGSPLSAALDQTGAAGQDLAAKLTQLRDGASELAAGNAQLAGGISDLDDGVHQLATGTAALRDGSAELATQLADGAQKVPSWSPEQKDAIASTIAGPVQLTSNHENNAPDFASGMAPFFLSLALFFGALVLWMALRPLQNRAIAAEVSALRVVLASYLPAALLATVQVVILYCVVRFALGLDFSHPVATLAFMLLVSWAFVALTQAVNAALGPALGRVLLIALLMLQLVSAGGLYPVETTATPFQTLHRYDPMAYGVNGLRQLILGGVDYRLWESVGLLVGVTLMGIVVSCLSARRNREWNIFRLIPPIKL